MSRLASSVLIVLAAMFSMGATSDCEDGCAELEERTGPVGVIAAVDPTPGDSIEATLSISRGLGGEHLFQSYDAFCDTMFEQYGPPPGILIDEDFTAEWRRRYPCGQYPLELALTSSQKLSEANPVFALLQGAQRGVQPGCVRGAELGDRRLHVNLFSGLHEMVIQGEGADPYRFVESVVNGDVCPTVLCETLEPITVPCHHIVHNQVLLDERGEIEQILESPIISLRTRDDRRPVLPDLVALPGLGGVGDLEIHQSGIECALASDFLVERGSPRVLGVRLRFPAAFANLGHGPLHVRPTGTEDGALLDDPSSMEQVIYSLNGENTWTIPERAAMEFHENHQHFHLTSLYSIEVVNPEPGFRTEGGGSQREALTKLGFCIEDTGPVESLPGYADNAPSTMAWNRGGRFRELTGQVVRADGEVVRHRLGAQNCRAEGRPVLEQGLAPGRMDLYNAAIPGQAVDLLNFPWANRLEIRLEVDPFDQVVELNERNNRQVATINLERFRVPWEALDPDRTGAIRLEDPRVQEALKQYCETIPESPYHRSFAPLRCAYGAAYQTAGALDRCFDYAHCDLEGEETCTPLAGGSYRYAVCVDVEGTLRRETQARLDDRCDRDGNIVEDGGGEP
jgi:hypothetical protein